MSTIGALALKRPPLLEVWNTVITLNGICIDTDPIR